MLIYQVYDGPDLFVLKGIEHPLSILGGKEDLTFVLLACALRQRNLCSGMDADVTVKHGVLKNLTEK